MERVIKVGDKDVKFSASGATPMKYRNAFPGRDIFRDIMDFDAASEDEIFGGDMAVFEQIAYTMSEAPMQGVSLEDWLSQFDLMDLPMALPEIVDLWADNAKVQSVTEKNAEATGR